MFLIRCRIFLMVLSLTFYGTVLAQNERNQLSLTAYLKNLQEVKNITFSYDAELLEGFKINKIDTNLSIESILKAMGDQLPFSFSLLKDSYVTIQSKQISLSLQIKDELSDGPVPGVYVKKNDQYTEKISDANGYITLQMDWRKGDTLSFEFLGYQKQKVLIKTLLLSGNKIIYLKEGTTVLNELVISGYLGAGIDAHQRNHSLNIKTDDLGILPGDNNKDLLVSLRALPGISTVTGRAGDLRIRGGTPDQTLLLYNNIPIYHKGYYYGTISPFSTDIVDDVKVYRSGFTPRLGGRVGGAIEINTDNSVPEKVVGGIATSSVFASGHIKAPIVKDKLGVSLSVRSSHPFDYLSPIEKEYEIMVIAASPLEVRSGLTNVSRDPVSFDFRDISSVLSWTPNEKDELTLNFLSISNENRTLLVDNNIQVDVDNQTSLVNNGLNFQWNRKWGQWESSFFFTSALYDYQVNNREFEINTDQVTKFDNQGNKLNTLKIGSIFSKKMAQNYHELTLGYEATRLRSSLNLEQFGRRAAPMRGPRSIPNQLATVHSIFGNYYVPDFNNFMFDLGLRTNYYTGNESLRLEPRLFVNYNLSDKITFKTSAGFYSQFIARNIFFDYSDLALEKLVWQLVVNREDEIIKSSQFLAGMSYQSDNWLFDFDAYYKRVDNITANGPIIAGPNVPGKLIGMINSRGMDFLIKRKIRNLNIWANYTLSKVDFDFRALKTDEFPANYDQRHLFNISAIYQQNQFRASLGWLFGSGVPNYLGDTFFPTTSPNRDPLPPPSRVGEIRRFDATHQLDASFAYEFLSKNKKMRFTSGISFLNIYNRENLLETVNITIGRPAERIPSNRYTIGFAPDIMLKIEWL